MFDQNIIQKNQFSFYLAGLLPGEPEDQRGGEIVFGEVDSSLYTGQFTYEALYVPVGSNLPLYWHIAFTQILVPNVAGLQAYSQPLAAFIDSGTSFIVAPSDQAD